MSIEDDPKKLRQDDVHYGRAKPSAHAALSIGARVGGLSNVKMDFAESSPSLIGPCEAGKTFASAPQGAIISHCNNCRDAPRRINPRGTIAAEE